MTPTIRQMQRHDRPDCRTTSTAIAPRIAPALKLAWSRTYRPGRSARAAVAATLATTSIAPPAATTPTRTAPNATGGPAAAPRTSSPAHVINLLHSPVFAPH